MSIDLFQDINSEISKRGKKAAFYFGKSRRSSFDLSTQIFTLEKWNLQQTKKGFRFKKMALRWTKAMTSKITEVYHRFKTYPPVTTSPCSRNSDPIKKERHLSQKKSNAQASSKRNNQRLLMLDQTFKCLVKTSIINANCARIPSVKKLRLAAMPQRSIPVNLLSTTISLMFVTGGSSFGSATMKRKGCTTLPSLKI